MHDFTNQFLIEVLINGRPVDEYEHQGNVFIEGRYGSDYELRLTNNCTERALFVVSVDGLSIMDGQPAGLNSDGYVINPYQSINVPGWRLNNTEVAKFVFGDETKSYANKSGRGKDNTGVIGMLVFREKQPIVGVSHQATRMVQLTASANANMGADWTKGSEMGTEFGNAVSLNTTEVAFERRDANYPDSFLTIYYDSARGLEKRGIILRHKKEYNPDPFPNYSNTVAGCKPPRDWRK